MEEVGIREISPSDNEELATIIRQVLLEMGMPKVGTAYADTSLDNMYSHYKAERSCYLIITLNGKLIGGAGIAPLDNSTENICELQKMYYLPEGRGKGLGYKMLKKCIAKATDFGYDKIYLETMPYMQSATKLYKKFGFKTIEKPLGDTGHHACQVWMTKDL